MVLALLARVNVLTTLAPHRADALEQLDSREAQLVPWAGHGQRKQWPAQWVIQPTTDDGTLHNANPTNTSRGVSCATRNYVELPTAVKQGALSIRIGDEVQVGIWLQNTKTRLSARASVRWSTHVTVHTLGNTIRVDAGGSHDPVPRHRSATLVDPAKLLADAFPCRVDLDGLVREGAWRPVFNADGNMLFEIWRHGADEREGDSDGRRLRQKRAPLVLTSGNAPELQVAAPRIGVEIAEEVADGSGAYSGNRNPNLLSIAAAPEVSEYVPSELQMGDESQASVGTPPPEFEFLVRGDVKMEESPNWGGANLLAPARSAAEHSLDAGTLLCSPNLVSDPSSAPVAAMGSQGPTLENKWAVVGCVSLISYDYFLTLDREIEYIWRRRITSASAIYIVTRYSSLASNILTFLNFFPWPGESSAEPGRAYTRLNSFAVHTLIRTTAPQV
ncbi:uncharacterized protein BXZ73DRAFT_98069 [Epithele typhae]|uniref:uncharacterized protein n=1 Tax=Epithele typhae TaxID=378194 RepID=UPI0020088B0F|nr:uncharacterized protein BXZ73DRAFT_98069 [Epithele typhae]KAH9941680.1 hypothetical protein BXZ73DRAFT_98069 [Epithele typhae]